LDPQKARLAQGIAMPRLLRAGQRMRMMMFTVYYLL
jgi:hypothetical protein